MVYLGREKATRDVLRIKSLPPEDEEEEEGDKEGKEEQPKKDAAAKEDAAKEDEAREEDEDIKEDGGPECSRFFIGEVDALELDPLEEPHEEDPFGWGGDLGEVPQHTGPQQALLHHGGGHQGEHVPCKVLTSISGSSTELREGVREEDLQHPEVEGLRQGCPEGDEPQGHREGAPFQDSHLHKLPTSRSQTSLTTSQGGSFLNRLTT